MCIDYFLFGDSGGGEPRDFPPPKLGFLMSGFLEAHIEMRNIKL